MVQKYKFHALALLIALIGAVWFFTRSTEPKLTYRFAPVDKGNIVAGVAATGAITPLSTVIVGSQLSGQVIEILADYNTEVNAGQVLARLDSTQIRARLDGLRADLAASKAQRKVQEAQIERVKADSFRIKAVLQDMTAQISRTEGQLAEAEKAFTRQNELNKGGFIASSVFEAAKTALNTAKAARESSLAQQASAIAQEQTSLADLKVAEATLLTLDAQIMQREAAVRASEVDVANTEIKSSVKGVVVQRQVELGMTVAASLQAPTLFLVAQDLREMEILANVDEADVGRIKPDQRVSFSVNAYPQENFEGKVKLVRLGAQTVQNVVIYTAVISFRNDEKKLKPGMTATLRVITDERTSVLRLSNAVLRWKPAGTVTTTAAQATPSLSLTPQAAPAAARPQGGRVLAELTAMLKSEVKLTVKQSDELERILKDKRQDFQSLQSLPDPAARAERVRTIRTSIFDELALSLDPSQKEALNALKERLEERTGRGTSARVYLLNAKGEPEVKQIRLGATDGVFTEIISGLKEGDKPIVGAK